LNQNKLDAQTLTIPNVMSMGHATSQCAVAAIHCITAAYEVLTEEA